MVPHLMTSVLIRGKSGHRLKATERSPCPDGGRGGSDVVGEKSNSKTDPGTLPDAVVPRRGHHLYCSPSVHCHAPESLNYTEPRITIWPCNSTPWGVYTQRMEDRCSGKHSSVNVHSSDTHNTQRWKQPKCPSAAERMNTLWSTHM